MQIKIREMTMILIFTIIISFVYIMNVQASNQTVSIEIAKELLQKYLDEFQSGTWNVEDLTKIDGISRKIQGMTFYTMDYKARVKVIQNIKPIQNMKAMKFSNYLGWDAFNSIRKEIGEYSTFTSKMTFRKKENGWVLSKSLD